MDQDNYIPVFQDEDYSYGGFLLRTGTVLPFEFSDTVHPSRIVAEEISSVLCVVDDCLPLGEVLHNPAYLGIESRLFKSLGLESLVGFRVIDAVTCTETRVLGMPYKLITPSENEMELLDLDRSSWSLLFGMKLISQFYLRPDTPKGASILRCKDLGWLVSPRLYNALEETNAKGFQRGYSPSGKAL